MTPGLLRSSTLQAADNGILDRLGVALYTVRDQMQADTVGTLKAIADLATATSRPASCPLSAPP